MPRRFRCARSWRSTARIRYAQAATKYSIRWDFRSRTSTPWASGGLLTPGRRSTHRASLPMERQWMGRWLCAKR